jgi:hypothetical protein
MASRGVDAQVRKITKREATEMLEANAVNRKLRPRVVEAYRRDMEQGRWKMTGEPIQISRSGALLNGQHRLTAFTGSDTLRSMEFLFVTGLDDRAQVAMDQGAARGVADALKIANGHVKNVTIVSGLCRWMVAHPDPGVPGMVTNLKQKISIAESVEAYERHGDILQLAADRAAVMRHHLPGSVTAIAYVYLQLFRVDAEACNEFFGAMMDMSFSAKGDPRKAALKRLTVMASNPEHKGPSQTQSVVVISVLTRAWNYWRKGEEIDTITGRNSKGQPIDPVQPI